MNVIFLDIDGVLNGHEQMENGFCGIKSDCIKAFNYIVREVDPKIVISSAWRYMVLGGSMNLDGFEHLLLTHGLDVYGRLIGHIPSDEDTGFDRGKQIWQYFCQNRFWEKEEVKYLVLEDTEELIKQIAEYNHPFYEVDGKVGLTWADAEKIIRYFREKKFMRPELRTLFNERWPKNEPGCKFLKERGD